MAARLVYTTRRVATRVPPTDALTYATTADSLHSVHRRRAAGTVGLCAIPGAATLAHLQTAATIVSAALVRRAHSAPE